MSIPDFQFSIEHSSDNLALIHKSKSEASAHEWVYHCTSSNALLSIIRNREFWLSNLKIVNDKEEANRIDRPEFENSYYVCCFTKHSNVSASHWEEYGLQQNGILFGVKQNWFSRSAVFLTSDNSACPEIKILSNYDEGLDYKLEQQKKERRITNPFYISSFGFFKIIYDNELRKEIQEMGTMSINGTTFQSEFLTPEVAGIVKNEYGECKRQPYLPYIKNWAEEAEIRLKVCVNQIENIANGNPIHDGAIMQKCFFPKIAIPLTSDSFNVLQIRFCPDYCNRDAFLSQVHELLPNSMIQVIS
jgi:hypothetical protein